MGLLDIQPSHVAQVLPTAKCSNCGNAVALAKLGEHVCRPIPPALPKPSANPATVTALLPPRLQNLVVPSPRVASDPRRPSFDDPGQRSPAQNGPPLARPPPNRFESRPRSPLSRQEPTSARPPVTYQPPAPRPSPLQLQNVENDPRPLPVVPDANINIDTKSGGAAGMAGVGRRGFAAAALMVDNGYGGRSGGMEPPVSAAREPARRDYQPPQMDPGWGPGMNYSREGSLEPPRSRNLNDDFGRGHSPVPPKRAPTLDIDTSRGGFSRGGTPALSPSTSSHSQSPPFPRSPDSGNFMSRSPSPPGKRPTGIEKHRHKPADINLPRVGGDLRPPPSPLTSGSEYTLSPSSEPPSGKRIPTERRPPPRAPSPSADSGYGGLAYAESIDSRPERNPSHNRRHGKLHEGDRKDKRDRSSSGTSKGQAGGRDSRTTGSTYSDVTALDRTITMLLQDDAMSIVSSSSPSPLAKTRPLPRLSEQAKSPKLPVRSKTTNPTPSPTTTAASVRASKTLRESSKDKDHVSDRKERPKICVRCERKVDNGRWVQAEAGKILCEKCWKNMYLPKCRRCNLPIEKQAVSSSDGQLKGKYHKECFNCHECHKPFPDKSFYVFDGKPLCAYHYHEANDSLCAAAVCGQPIEGPCAVSHTGDRYHPEHLLCEYPGYPKCKERLEDYWEVDGRLLCEKHANAAVRGEDEEDEEEEEQRWARRGQKRTTRFIDLSGGAPLR